MLRLKVSLFLIGAPIWNTIIAKPLIIIGVILLIASNFFRKDKDTDQNLNEGILA